MLKRNKFKVILSAIIILLPMLFGIIMWNDLPNIMTTHWGADGNADGFSGKAFAVFGIPVILLVLQFVCVLFTLLDKKQREQNSKALGMIFWIVPMLSIVVNGIMYCAAFGLELDLVLLMGIPFGAIFILIGNYLPKTKQNRTLGIKVYWALGNEENWNKTHRFAGKLWVACGLVILLAAFLPTAAALVSFGCALALGVIAPAVYSYRLYLRHKKQGIEYTAALRSKGERIAVRISAVAVLLILVGAAVLMLTGNIEVKCQDDAIHINATYYTDTAVNYSDIDSVEYRNNFSVGTRMYGFGSARLSMGIFQNDEFGSYTLYSYTGAEEFVVLTSGEKTLVIGIKDTNVTREIYNTITEKTGLGK